MRKRIKKKKAKKAKTLFEIKKSLAIAQLIIDTYQALGRLFVEPYNPALKAMAAHQIVDAFKVQKSLIIQARGN